jgi:hypothetical protein
VDLQAEGAGARATAWPMRPMPMMPSRLPPMRRPASRSATSRPVLALGDQRCALDQPARHRQDQRHGHVGGVLGQHARRVGDGDAALRAVATSILSTPAPKLAISFSLGRPAGDQRRRCGR